MSWALVLAFAAGVCGVLGAWDGLAALDGRAPLRDIAATHHGIEEVVRVLAAAVDGEDGARDLLRGDVR